MLPRPPSFHRGVYVYCRDRGDGSEDERNDANGGGGGFHTGGPLPEAWVQIGRYGVQKMQRERQGERAREREREVKRWDPPEKTAG